MTYNQIKLKKKKKKAHKRLPVLTSRPSLAAPVDRTGLLCPSCHQWLQPDNHRVRLRPKRRPSARLQLILRRSAAGKHLSTSESKLLRRFRASSSTLVRESSPR